MKAIAARHGFSALIAPVHVDRERDLGRYEEPNVWMRHPVTSADA